MPIPAEDRISASDSHVTWNTRSFVKLCKRAKDEGLVAGIVHSHPGGLDGFSTQADENELDPFRLLQNRNGDGAQLVSMIQVGEAL